jgi:hypothetical protein
MIFIAWVVISVARCPREPSYRERTLSQWTIDWIDARTEPNGTVEQLETAGNAIKAIGTNAIPTALRWLSKNYNARDYFHFAAFRRGYPLFGMGENILGILGAQAKPAAPGLIQLVKNGKDAGVRKVALLRLLKLNVDKTMVTPVFIECAEKDEDAKVRGRAFTYVIEYIGVDKKTGMALLATLLHDPDIDLRHQAEIYTRQADWRFDDSTNEVETNDNPNK